MKIRFIINPISGTGTQASISKSIDKYLKNRNYDIVYTKKAGDGYLLSLKSIKEKVNIVIAVGGDGTVNECAKALINTETALGVIPCGSGNGFAYHIGMNKQINKAIQQLNKCTIRSIDTAEINTIPFVNVAGIGFDAHVANIFSSLEKRGFIEYIKIIFKELTYKPKEYIIKDKIKEIKVKAFFIAFANASQYGNDINISPLSIINDHKIEIVIVKEFAKWKIPIFLYHLYLGNIHKTKYIEIIKTKKIQIICNEQLIHADGEPNKVKNPINIEIKPNNLKIFC